MNVVYAPIIPTVAASPASQYGMQTLGLLGIRPDRVRASPACHGRFNEVIDGVANAPQDNSPAPNSLATQRAVADAADAASKLGMDGEVTWAVQALALNLPGPATTLTAARLLGFCDSGAGTLHRQRQAGGAEEILYLRLLASLNEHLNPAVVAAAMVSGSGLSESDALKIGMNAGEFENAAG